jgi:aryl-alcohol dehydrogenase-like predicted oxidoreductase
MAPPSRPLGRNGPSVPAIGFGAMSLGGAYGQKDSTEDKLKVLDRAWEIGQRFWDTADVYGDSEDRIGEWFKKTGKRDDIFIATKFGLHYTPQWDQTERSDPEYVRSACEKSLQRLGVETIDLFYCHRVDNKTPIEKTIEAMAGLKKWVVVVFSDVSPPANLQQERARSGTSDSLKWQLPTSAVHTPYTPFRPCK